MHACNVCACIYWSVWDSRVYIVWWNVNSHICIYAHSHMHKPHTHTLTLAPLVILVNILANFTCISMCVCVRARVCGCVQVCMCANYGWECLWVRVRVCASVCTLMACACSRADTRVCSRARISLHVMSCVLMTNEYVRDNRFTGQWPWV